MATLECTADIDSEGRDVIRFTGSGYAPSIPAELHVVGSATDMKYGVGVWADGTLDPASYVVVPNSGTYTLSTSQVLHGKKPTEQATATVTVP